MAWVNNDLIGILLLLISVGCTIGFWNSDDLSNASDNFFG